MKKSSPQKAIATYCKGCIYDPLAVGTYIQQIEGCTITTCELYEHRPLTKAAKLILKQNKLEALTPGERARADSLSEKRSNLMSELHKTGKFAGVAQ